MNNYPECCYSHDLNDNCTIIKWGESGYYKTDLPSGKYNDDVVNELNLNVGVTPKMRRAMEICSMVSQSNPKLDWKKHYDMIMSKEEVRI